MFRNILFLSVLWCVTVHCKIEYLSDENEDGGTSVDLSNMGIMQLKNNFLNNSMVTRLDLSNNYILEIEDGAFNGLPNLCYLNLTGNVFPFGNLNFTNLSAVETLVLDKAISNRDHRWYSNSYYSDLNDKCNAIRGNRQRDYDNTIVLLASMKFLKLKKLYLCRNNIRAINLPGRESLSDIMPNITHLYLNENSFESVDFLTKFPPTLTHLYLDNNYISGMKINRSTNSLKVLTVNRNRIKTLCEPYQPYQPYKQCNGISMEMFEHLEYFSIANVGLYEIAPNSFKYSSALNYLNMSHNEIREIENNTFHNLINLKTLILENNQLIAIPNISGLKRLEYFTISYNKIKSLDTLAFHGLSNLKELNLSHNALEKIAPETFFELTSLEKLDLSSNKLEMLPIDWISSKSNLQYLSLRDNLFKSLSSMSITGIQSLQYVNIADNPLKLIDIKTLMAFPENTTVDITSLIAITDCKYHNYCG